ncbi:MAG: site-specific integrase [Terracidiphilus sp.]|jgi:integrase
MQEQIVPRKPIPAALESLIQRNRAFLVASKAPNTMRGYQSDWTDFLCFTAEHNFVALPADPATVSLYLTSRSSILAAATLTRRLSAIAFYHLRAGYIESPTYHPLVRETFKGIRREIGTAQKVKDALLSDQVRKIVACCPETLAGLRDKSLFLISFAIGARRSETAGLRIENLTFSPDGLIVTIAKSKTDQEKSGSRKVGIPYGTDEATCPIRVLKRYTKAAGIISGYVLRSIDQKGRVSPFGLHPDSVGYIIKRCAARAGMKVEEISGHSLRSGFCTEAARQNVPEYLIRRQAGFNPGSKILDRYIRLGEMFTRNAAAGLGL